MRSIWIIFGLVGALICAALAVALWGERERAEEAARARVVARVDARVLTVDDLRVIDPKGMMTAEQRRELVENWIDRELLLKIADEDEVDIDPAVKLRVEAARAEVLLDELGRRYERRASSSDGGKEMLIERMRETRIRSRIEAHPWKTP